MSSPCKTGSLSVLLCLYCNVFTVIMILSLQDVSVLPVKQDLSVPREVVTDRTPAPVKMASRAKTATSSEVRLWFHIVHVIQQFFF